MLIETEESEFESERDDSWVVKDFATRASPEYDTLPVKADGGRACPFFLAPCASN